MTTPRTETIQAWAALQTTSRLLIEAIETALQSRNLPSLSWYDALLEIERAEAGSIRPYELKERLLLPQYSTSRLLERLISAELIEKLDCADDGRGFSVRITSKGRLQRRKMWRIYATSLSDVFEKPLTVAELKNLEHLMKKIRPT